VAEAVRPHDLIVRPARQGDLAAAGDLLVELDALQSEWRVFPPRHGVDQELLERYRTIERERDAVHLVAELSGRIVGMAMATVHRPSSFSDRLSVEVSSFVVRSGYRGTGVGRALLAQIGRFAADRRVRHLDLRVFSGNEEAVRFWRRMGFRDRMVQMVADVDEIIDAASEP
jgi:GNAT superfamily N-acetyltransferase